jgi:hypothetical protein
LSKSKYSDSVVEGDTRIGDVMDKIRALGPDKVLVQSGDVPKAVEFFFDRPADVPPA